MSPGHEVLRQQIAACSRLLVEAGILSYSGHVSARVQDHLLIQRVHDVRATLEPGRLLVVGLDGRPAAGDGKPPAEVFIHTEVYRARPDVMAVAHFHHDPTTVFSMVPDRPLVPVKNHASRWGEGVAVHPDPSHIATPEQGAQVAKTLGDQGALLLRAHGEVVVAEDVLTLYADVVHLVENAAVLAMASQLGPVEALSPAEQAAFLATFNRADHARKLWKYYTAVAAKSGVIPADWVLDQDHE
jgi:ribulose-5-phosphate 4-epimerase/fuculose-1-phosphate aldolase